MLKKTACLTLIAILVAIMLGMVGSAAPGTGRLPWTDYQKLLRFQVMAPGVEVPEQEYMLHTTGPLTKEQAQEAVHTSKEQPQVKVDHTTSITRTILTKESEKFEAEKKNQ